jgi:integrase
MTRKPDRPAVETLADVAELLQAGSIFEGRRRGDVLSDLRALARITGRALETLPADLRRLRPLLDKVHPVQAGVSRKRLQNIRSSLVAVLRAVRFGPAVALSKTPIVPVWQTLLECLPREQDKYALSAFFRYCSQQGLSPDDVTDEMVAAYYQYLLDHSLRADPKAVYQRTCRTWNAARRSIPDWPDVDLAVPSFRPPKITFPLEDFPASFGAELQRYSRWLAGEDLLSDHQPPQRCGPRTIAGRLDHIHRLASAAVHRGIPVTDIDSLATLVSRPVVEASLQWYVDRFEGRTTNYLRDLAKTLKLIALHWVRCDKAHVDWLRQLIRRLDTEQPGLTEKNRATLRQFDSPANIQRLLAVPDALMAQAASIKDPYRAAHRYLWGLVIELFTYAPMRIGNLATLRIDRHLVRPEGPKGPVIIALTADETKNGRPHEYPLPSETVRKLDRYLADYRPALLTSPEVPWLFPDRHGHHKSTITISGSITDRIFRETGLKITPHQFRHLAAKLILAARPAEYELARQVLGHRHVSTTVNFYAGMQSAESVALYDEIVTTHREQPDK